MANKLEQYAKEVDLTLSEVEELEEEGELVLFDSATELFQWLYIEDSNEDDYTSTLESFFHFRANITEGQSFGEAFLLDEDRIHCIEGTWYFRSDM